MFGYSGGETADVVARKRDMMKSAQARWPFLTTIDCSTIKTRGQFVSLIRTRAQITEEKASDQIDAWMKSNNFRT